MSKKPAPEPAADAPNATGNKPAPKVTRGERRAQEAKRQLHKKRHQMLFALIGVALLINGLLGYWLYESMVVDKERQRVHEAAQARAQQTVVALGGYLDERRAEVHSWAQNADLIAALKNNDAQAAAKITRKLAAQRPELIALRAFAEGDADIQPDHVAPLRYAELDLLRRAYRRQDVLPEAAPDGEQWYLQVASAVPAKGEVSVGSLLATYTSEGIQQIVTRHDSALGKLSLRQTYSGHRAYELHRDGSGQAAPAVQMDVPNSYLSVEYTPSVQLQERSQELPGMWILTLSLSVTLSLGGSLLLSRLLVRPQTTPAGDGLVLPQKHVDVKAGATSNAETPSSAASTADGSSALHQDILDIAVAEEDEDILGLDDATARRSAPAAPRKKYQVPESVFRSYDIRGEVCDTGITPEFAYHVGLALGSEVLEQGESAIIVARDARSHSPELCEALIAGLLATGCDVINIGVVPTPLMYFATFVLDETNSGVMVTASHNGAQYNGFKMVINGQTLADGAIQDIRARMAADQHLEGEGSQRSLEIVADYIDHIFSDVALAGDVRLVVDAGNAVAGVVAPALFEELGCEVIPLHCELDGRFPNHTPDPTCQENLQDLIAKVRETEADLGVAFDGDGDRLVVVTAQGEIIWPDHLLMLFAKDILSRNPGADVLFDVKCSKQLNQIVSGYGGRPIMWKTGHSHMKQKMLETGALLGGEYSGHIFIKERWYGFDDGLYTAARLLEIITLRDQSVDDVFAAFPMLPATPEIRVAVPEADKFKLIETLIVQGEFQNGKATTIDGLRVDFSKGWGLVRASNTGPELTLRFEAESEAVLDKLKLLFKRELKKIDKTLKLDF
jgi:phosphomannomutase/phosphoglucomutase